MNEIFNIMLPPMVACLIIVGIHAYLGIHILKRGVIFVDLALAQVSALGATMGFLFGFGLDSAETYWFALGFTIFGAALFSGIRRKNPLVPPEALIGTIYVISAAMSILVLSRAAEGGEELKEILVGHLLFVEWPEIIKLFFIYSAIGLLHWFVRKKLILISEDPAAAFEKGMRVRLWDFLFYATFGIVVTNSVRIIGVLLVFSFLIVPSICGAYLGQRFSARLAIGWLVGILTSLVGLFISYQWDLPTGAAVVCTFGLSLIVCAALGRVVQR